MKFDGGYNVMLEGEPSKGIAPYEKPDKLYLPLFSDQVDFSLLLQVEHGETVNKGHILAKDPVNYSVPLLAPMGGTVNLEVAERHIVLEDLHAAENSAAESVVDEDPRQTLVRLGVWSSITRLDNNKIPDPEKVPENLIVPVSRFEPYFPDPETVLDDAADQFARGLEHLHKILDDTRIVLIVADNDATVKSLLQKSAADHRGWLTLHEVPGIYPFDSPALAAQLLKHNPEKTWTADVQTIIAAQAAIEDQHPYVKRIVSVSGPMVESPRHCQVPLGYPLANLFLRDGEIPLRIVNGGVLTGTALEADQLGLDCSCQALTVLEEITDHEVLAFVQPGFSKRSYSNTFASFFKPLFKEKFTTALGGEARPCVFCGFCESVCPAGIIPHLIYRYLDNDRPEDAYRVEFDKCIDCGLCSYVCVSKINHLRLFRAERDRVLVEDIEG